ncbi:uncharacterized protein PHACADRAFT_173548 [Phanerochaete carnosa HHB-10118-sp]|uniref:Uncharacterized protein n=1 Tax=Phanerochaete carnosa (strain HHB-10118-sp) TaxID=650164 RepID=K5W8Z2_PHACS|nr:uncharacterized protein PHACADRAFT_173548 [Phanerochaete carnosa HHB-10118-sp]EKM55434.1 hypothetical protein PHACADRAFT_173548 [Phanerochaete carnosa HHB-10118-sp]
MLSPLFLAATLLLLSAFAHNTANAQVAVNGQIFTNGLAIVDAPQPGTTLHAGATQSVAIDISGDGHLPADSGPGSSSATHFDSLEIYLTSYATSLNLTVSSGPVLLTQEPGSTVKHVNWLIDSCIPSGNYNLTFYEGSHINSEAFFIITPLPIEIQNTNSNPGQCSNGTNPIQSYPQAQVAPSHSPWLDANNSTSNVQYPSVADAAVGLAVSPIAAVAMSFLLYSLL